MGPFLVTLGAVLALSNANRLRLALQSRGWPTVPGRVEETAVRDPGWTINDVGPSKWQDVLYHYQVGGKYLVAHRKYFTGWTENFWRRINYSTPTYEAGADVVVCHHPTNPKLAVLEAGVPLGLAADYVVSLVFLAVGAWLWVVA